MITIMPQRYKDPRIDLYWFIGKQRPRSTSWENLLTLVIFLLVSLAASIHASAEPATPPVQNFYEDLQRAVTFLFMGGKAEEQPTATGFIVGVPVEAEHDDGRRFAKFLVSARHVLNPSWAHLPDPISLYARFNLKGKKGTTKLQLPPAGSPLLIEPDDDTDIAAAVVIIPDEWDVIMINAEDFMSEDEIRTWHIGVGAEVFTSALLTSVPGNSRNYPVAKFGRISSIPTEPIAIHLGPHEFPPKEGKYWLLEMNQLGGNSGAPVFLKPTDLRVQSGLTIQSPPTKIIGINTTQFLSGTAGMVPIQALHSLLKQKAAQSLRLPAWMNVWPSSSKFR